MTLTEKTKALREQSKSRMNKIRRRTLRVTTTYAGYNCCKDDQIKSMMKQSGGVVTGSGYGFGERDINASFKTARDVLSFKRRMSKERGFKKTKITVCWGNGVNALTHQDLLQRAREERAGGL